MVLKVIFGLQASVLAPSLLVSPILLVSQLTFTMGFACHFQVIQWFFVELAQISYPIIWILLLILFTAPWVFQAFILVIPASLLQLQAIPLVSRPLMAWIAPLIQLILKFLVVIFDL